MTALKLYGSFFVLSLLLLTVIECISSCIKTTAQIANAKTVHIWNTHKFVLKMHRTHFGSMRICAKSMLNVDVNCYWARWHDTYCVFLFIDSFVELVRNIFCSRENIALFVLDGNMLSLLLLLLVSRQECLELLVLDTVSKMKHEYISISMTIVVWMHDQFNKIMIQ